MPTVLLEDWTLGFDQSEGVWRSFWSERHLAWSRGEEANDIDDLRFNWQSF